MKSILLFLAIVSFSFQSFAQNAKPAARTTFHAVGEDGKPLSDTPLHVEITFAKLDENGNKVPIYIETFEKRTTRDGYFQREVGKDFASVEFGNYEDVDFACPNLCMKVSYKVTLIAGNPLIEGDWVNIAPVPVAAVAVNDKDQDDKNEIQVISKDGDQVGLSKDGGMITLNDDDPTNELQILSFDPETKTLHLMNGNTVDLSPLSPFSTPDGNTACTDRVVQANRFVTKDGRTDIEGGKISLRNGDQADGIEMGIDEEGYPFMTFISPEGEILAEIRMGGEGFCLYKN